MSESIDNRRSTQNMIDMKTHWQLYKELEFLPESLPEPMAGRGVFTFPLRQAWKTLLNFLAQELIHEQQIELLERCLQKEFINSDNSENTWTKFLKLLD